MYSTKHDFLRENESAGQWLSDFGSWSEIYQEVVSSCFTVEKMESVLNSIDNERIYQHILKTEGEKHPLHSPERMEACADYILAELESYDLKANAHEFTVDGFDYAFRNIEATTSGDGPELLVVSHYDTGRHAPGANDNGSAIAVMLEAARVISLTEAQTAVRFISFNLEELNPLRAQKLEGLALKHGIRDKDGRYTSWQTSKVMKRFSDLHTKLAMNASSYAEATAQAIKELDSELTSSERQYLEGIQALSEGITPTNWPGRTALAGSSAWVHDAVKRGQQIKGVLNLETVGYTSDQKYSQQLPSGMSTEMLEIYGTDPDLLTGNFLFVLRDRNSKDLAKQFCTQCKHDAVHLPYACLQIDITYEEAAHGMRDLLRSDHAPFWKENIPALLLSDGADFRYPYYHTRADTIDKLDFDFLGKICRAVVSMTLNA
jgi:hypothetical protein